RNWTDATAFGTSFGRASGRTDATASGIACRV
ncbi:hypothetical protein A2U01_0095253, partial [Trifolium medium]|nr:hypothetical protein [Trifolium medium]